MLKPPILSPSRLNQELKGKYHSVPTPDERTGSCSTWQTGGVNP